MHNVTIHINASRTNTIHKKYTNIFTRTPKTDKTTKCFFYIKMRLHLVYQHQLEGGYNPLSLLALTRMKHLLPMFMNTN